MLNDRRPKIGRFDISLAIQSLESNCDRLSNRFPSRDRNPIRSNLLIFPPSNYILHLNVDEYKKQINLHDRISRTQKKNTYSPKSQFLHNIYFPSQQGLLTFLP